MNRFLIAFALAAVAAATYVATATGGLRAAPSPAKLQREITALQKQVKAGKTETDGVLGLMALCIVHQPIAVDQVGNATDGYLFGSPTTTSGETATSALNLAPSTETSPQHKFFALNTSNQTCVAFANSASTLTTRQALVKFATGH